MTEIIKQIAEIVKHNDNFLITTHIRSDPDGISSELALYYMLKRLNKKVLIVNDSTFPESLNFLLNNKNPEIPSNREDFLLTVPEYKQLKEKIDFTTVISLDTPNLNRLGKVADIIPENAKIINIDHHISNNMFGDINLVDPKASSTGEMIYNLFKVAEQEITEEIAKALYTSLITDTGRFVHSNTSPECLRIASRLMEHGANPTEISKHIYQTNTYSVLKLQAMAINSLKLEAEGRIAVIWLTKKMLEESGVTEELDTQVFSDIPLSIESVTVGVFLKEMEDSDEVKVSLRSKDSVDVNQIANKFGGGGHIKASGCELADTIEETHKKVVNEVIKALN